MATNYSGNPAAEGSAAARRDAIEMERVRKTEIVSAAAVLPRAELNRAGIEGTIPDDLNPAFLLSTVDAALLAAIVAGRIDVRQIAIDELAARGLDIVGRYVGFSKGGR